MQKRSNLIFITGFFIFLTASIAAQNGTNSPYTRYGYGDLSNRSLGAGRSMGGVGIGLHSSRLINPMNPATYAFLDSTTFLFDFAATLQLSYFNDGTNKQNDLNGNVNYMAMQFPINHRIAMSVGLLPFSHVGYLFGNEHTTIDGQRYQESFQGSGGLNQLYGGLSIELWKKRLSIGSNINYLFGTLTHAAQTQFSSASATNLMDAELTKFSNVHFDFGIQSINPLSKSENLVVGIIFAPKKRLKGKVFHAISEGSSLISSDTITGLSYDIPTGYGLGASYVKANKLIVAADFTFQEWSKASFKGKNNAFNDRSKIAAGFEFIPNYYSQPYINRMRYRAGVNYTNSYINVDGNGYKEYGATAGIGFPISDNRSFVNFSIEYLKVVPNIKSMINENYFRVTLSYTFNEYWFFKRKVD